MINKLKEILSNMSHSMKEENSYRNENGLKSFIEDYVTYVDVKDLYL